MLAYSIFSFREIAIYTKTIPHVSSKNFTSETKWLKSISVFMLVIVLLDLLQSQMKFISVAHFKIPIEVVVQIGLLLFVSMINYQGLKNPHSFQQISDSDIAMSKSSETKSTLATIDKNKLQELANKLEEYMKQDQPFLNPELNINILAGTLAVPEKTISQAINHIIGSNFSDYINSYRIEYARLKLEQDNERSISIKEVMYDVGFNSRSVFNTAFKKKTGLTPSEYQKRHK
jgi:AraC-like DNA-binding protein